MESGVIRFMGKGGKERIVQIGEESVIELLNRYYTENKEEIHACGYFFINKRKSRFTEQSIRLMLKKYTKQAKIERNITPHIQWFASKQANAHDVFFVGRGIDYAICMEGSLKMKEISYIHSEAYAAGELKHGTISLIEDDILVVGVLTQPDLYEKTISNMVECRSRGAYLMGLTTFGQYNIEDSTDFAVYIPKIDPHFATSLAVIPLQLLGYYISVAKGLDVDKPRNLAKSVTVEYASMNMWGLTPKFMQILEDGFKEFFANMGDKDILKAEYLLPIYIDELLQAGRVFVKVLDTNDKWFGVTYKEDKDYVVKSFARLIEDGVYQKNLFEDLK